MPVCKSASHPSSRGANVPAAKLPPLRRDPKPRQLNGSAIWAQLRDRDADKHYVYVNKSDADAMAHYDAAGYEVEYLREGGVRPAGGKTVKLGEPIEMRGMQLMSVTAERAAQIELEGVDGDSGQLEADRVENMIIDRRGYDPLRGMHQRFISVQNEIQAPEVVVQRVR